MRFLTDENVEPLVVDWLRSQGYDVVSALVDFTGYTDDQILQRAADQARVLITHDLDFGKLVFREEMPITGVILLRLTAAPVIDRLELLKRQWPAIMARCVGHFVVVNDYSLKSRPVR